MPELNTCAIEEFFELLTNSLRQSTCEKLLLGKYRGADTGLQRLSIWPLNLRGEAVLSFVYSYKTRDITKNFAIETGLQAIRDILNTEFKNAHLLTSDFEAQLEFSKKGKASLHKRQAAHVATAKLADLRSHDRSKTRQVDITRPYLSALGITDTQHKLIPAMARKWKQINKFVEVFGQALEQAPLAGAAAIKVVDFGSGKGYLTFAIHDYLHHSLGKEAQVVGVELRAELVDLCNGIASQPGHDGLIFVCGDVQTHAPSAADVMIALHACDTATDHAIHYGIRAGASIIMCSPCCHKQIRPQMHQPEPLRAMLQHGIHLGQEAEMVTDSLRALLLEASGYNTKVFEFVSLEHTNKNKMILAVKRSTAKDNQQVLAQIAALKQFYGIRQHCLEELLFQAVE